MRLLTTTPPFCSCAHGTHEAHEIDLRSRKRNWTIDRRRPVGSSMCRSSFVTPRPFFRPLGTAEEEEEEEEEEDEDLTALPSSLLLLYFSFCLNFSSLPPSLSLSINGLFDCFAATEKTNVITG